MRAERPHHAGGGNQRSCKQLPARFAGVPGPSTVCGRVRGVRRTSRTDTLEQMARRIIFVSLLLALSGCSAAPRPRVTPAPRLEPVTTLRIGTMVSGQRQILAVPLEDYVLVSALSEIAPASGDIESARTLFSVQAIVARTYAIANRRRHAAEGFDLCDTTHCQVVNLDRPQRSRWAEVARRAVDDTRGTILWYAGGPASALFHSDCGGHRASADDVWGGPAPLYLQGGEDSLPAGYEHITWRFVADREQLRSALNAQPRTAVGARLDTIDVQRRDGSGRAALLLLNGERAPLVRGEEFRAVVSRRLGARALLSARFEVRREGERFVFEGQGFGHGVGLCQRGALARAASGDSVGRILAFYFPGTQIRRLEKD